jgi:hypothetical protein
VSGIDIVLNADAGELGQSDRETDRQTYIGADIENKDTGHAEPIRPSKARVLAEGAGTAGVSATASTTAAVSTGISTLVRRAVAGSNA